MTTADEVAIIVAVATMAQAVFTWWGGKIQQLAADAESDRRLKERNASDVRRGRDLQDGQDAAYMQLWAEHFRLESLADQWDSSPLAERSLLGVLDPNVVLPANSSEFVRLASLLGRESGFLCAIATTFAQETALRIAHFNADVQRLRGEFGNTTLNGVLEMLQRSPRQFQSEVASLRHGVRELSLLYWDVVRHSPRSDVQRTLAFRDDATSAFAREAIGAVAERARQARSGPKPEAEAKH